MNSPLSGRTFLTVQVVMLVVLQAAVTALLWFINPISQSETDTFALFLSVDLVALAMISYMYRTQRTGGRPSAPWLAIGYLSLVVLLTSNLLIS